MTPDNPGGPAGTSPIADRPATTPDNPPGPTGISPMPVALR